jgi:hypothetical protein
MKQSHYLLIGSYLVMLGFWTIVSWKIRAHNGNWGFTPAWHRKVVPTFRFVFLLSLPMEFFLAGRTFIPELYLLGLIGTIAWLGKRFHFLFREPRPYSALSSIPYNVYYTINLICFGLFMHSFVCLALLINMSALLLLIRVHYYKKGTGSQ